MITNPYHWSNWVDKHRFTSITTSTSTHNVNCTGSSITREDEKNIRKGYEELKFRKFIKQETGWELSHNGLKTIVVENAKESYSNDDLKHILTILKYNPIIGDSIKLLLQNHYINEYISHPNIQNEVQPTNHFRLDKWLMMIMEQNISFVNLRLTEEKRFEELQNGIMDAVRTANYSIYTGTVSIGDGVKIDCKIKQKENEEMTGLRIKKTDEMSIEEFKENTKPYDKVILKLNKEKIDEWIDDYGKLLMSFGDEEYVLTDDTIEFKNKAIFVGIGQSCSVSHSIPYELIDNVICEYYIKTEQ